jgi:hypothetical protein
MGRATLSPSRTAIVVNPFRDVYFFVPLEAAPNEPRVLFRLSWLEVEAGRAQAWVTPSPTSSIPADADDITRPLRELEPLNPWSPRRDAESALPGGDDAVLLPFLSLAAPTELLAVDLAGPAFTIVRLPSALEYGDPFHGRNLVANMHRAARTLTATAAREPGAASRLGGPSRASTVLLRSLYFASNKSTVSRFGTSDAVGGMLAQALGPHRLPGFFHPAAVRGLNEKPSVLSADNEPAYAAGAPPPPNGDYGNGPPDPYNLCSLQQAAMTGRVVSSKRVAASGSVPAAQGGLVVFGPETTGAPIAFSRICAGVDMDSRLLAAVEKRPELSASSAPSPSSSSGPATPLVSWTYSLAVYIIRGAASLECHDADGRSADGAWTPLVALDEDDVRVISAFVRPGLRWRIRARSTSASVAISIVPHAYGSPGSSACRPVDPSCVHLEVNATAADEPVIPGGTPSARLMSYRASGGNAFRDPAGSDTVQGLYLRPIFLPKDCPAGTAACFPTIFVPYAPGEARPSSLRCQQPPLVDPQTGPAPRGAHRPPAGPRR